MPARTLELIGVLRGSRRPGAGELEALVELASANKVLLGLLRRAGVGGRLRALEEARYRRFAKGVAEVARALSGLDYALYKFRKPVEHVSVDVDVLVGAGDVGEAARRLVSRGFRVEVVERYTVTLRRGSAIVDLYTHPSFAWVIYLDGSELMRCCAEEFDFEGASVRGLTREAEAVVSAAHAVYKEHVYLLLDYFTVGEWLTRRALRLSEELGVADAVRVCRALNDLVDRGLAELPYRLPAGLLAEVYLRKLAGHPHFRGTLLNALRYLATRRVGRAVRWRLTRKTY